MFSSDCCCCNNRHEETASFVTRSTGAFFSVMTLCQVSWAVTMNWNIQGHEEQHIAAASLGELIGSFVECFHHVSISFLLQVSLPFRKSFRQQLSFCFTSQRITGSKSFTCSYWGSQWRRGHWDPTGSSAASHISSLSQEMHHLSSTAQPSATGFKCQMQKTNKWIAFP